MGMWTNDNPKPGLLDGKLRRCPATPNCVCSEKGNDSAHYIEPFSVSKDADNVIGAVSEVVENHPGGNVITQDSEYLHAEFTTPVLRFVDDVEFRYCAEEGLLFARSASRVGRSDLGTNRRRLKRLHELLRERAIVR